MNDFAKISKSISSDNPDFSACTGISRGIDHSYYHYHLFRGHKPLKVIFRPSTDTLTISGCFGMFWNGHNLAFPYSDFRDSLSHVSEQLNVDLFRFNVDQFDQSAVVKVEESPVTIIQNHLSLKGHEETIRKFGKYWDHQHQIVKMYDATKRMKQVYTKPVRAGIYTRLGISDKVNLIRFEKKYKKPQKTFNRALVVEELLTPGFIDHCNSDLIETYTRIMKTGIITLPGSKKDLTSSTIPLIILQELSAVYGFDTRELIRQRIKSIPPAILTKDDRKQRQRQIDTNLKKIRSAEKSRYDISDLLADSLNAES